MTNYKPYEYYKEVEDPWLNLIPEHWKYKKVKYLFSERVDKGYENEPLLAATQIKGVIPKEMYENRTVIALKDLHLLKLVEKGDFVISLRSFQGGIEYAYYRGIISPAYTIMQPENEELSSYYKYLFKSKLFISNLTNFVTGIREGQNIDYSKFKNAYMPVPSNEEVKKISEFLTEKEKQVKKFISKKKKLIKLLNEQKQAIIDQAVTKGLDPDVALKPSGFDWLGDIPEHWKVKKLKRCTRFTPSKQESNYNKYSEDKAVFLPMEKVSTYGEVDCSEKKSISELWDGYTYFRKEDVVIAKITPCFENGKGACLDSLETDIGFGTTEFIVLRADKKILLPQYLYQITRMPSFRIQGKEMMTGAAGQQRVPVDFIKNYLIGIPPLEEQNQIFKYIEKESKTIDYTISRTEKEIELIQEYRTRLISDVVTGKIDVRDITVEDADIEITDIEEELEILDESENNEEVEVEYA